MPHQHPGIRLICFGTPHVTLNEQPLTLKRRKSLALLVYLAVANRPVDRETLINLLWPDAAPKVGLSSLRNVLADLNATPMETFLEIDRHTVALSPDFVSDVKTFRLLLKRTKEERSGSAVSLMEQAVKLNTGPFLEGFYIGQTPQFDDWRVFRQHEFHQRLQHLLLMLTEHYMQQGDDAPALRFARRLYEMESVNENAAALLMTLYLRGGAAEEAMQIFHVLKRALKRELDCEPQPHVRAIYDSILTGNYLTV